MAAEQTVSNHFLLKIWDILWDHGQGQEECLPFSEAEQEEQEAFEGKGRQG